MNRARTPTAVPTQRIDEGTDLEAATKLLATILPRLLNWTFAETRAALGATSVRGYDVVGSNYDLGLGELFVTRHRRPRTIRRSDRRRAAAINREIDSRKFWRPLD